MKRIVLIGAALLAWAMPALADDATVLPAGVLRVYAVPSYSWSDGQYDGSGKYSKYDANDGKSWLFNLGFAVEYGINDWITAALQWAPGINVASELESSPEGANLNFTSDLFAGAKFLIVGPKAPVASETWRFALAPGVIVPIATVDNDKQTDNIVAGKDYTLDFAHHAFGYGARAYLDYVINEQIFVNLYLEDILFLKTNKTVLGQSGVKHDYEYGYQLTAELEPHYTLMFGEDSSLSFGLPFTYVTSPEVKEEGDPDGNGAPSHLSLGPNASYFLYKTFIPLEFKAAYVFDVMGKNSPAFNSLVFQIKTYAKF